MDNLIKKIRENIKQIKNDAIHRYYDLRINKVKEPFRVKFRKEPYKIVFILGHMRSGSSLLTNILTSQPEILGYGETHLQYASEFDFKRLMFKLYWKTQEFKSLQDLKKLRMNHKYIMDKVLHNSKIEDENLLTNENLYAIFLVREPKRTIASILDLKQHWSEEKALNCYLKRLSTLEKYSKLINNKERSLFVTYDQLINETDLTFKALKNLLGTRSQFSEEYAVNKKTGVAGIGDPTEKIKAGRIVRNPRKLENTISIKSAEKGIKQFNNTCSTLSEYCSCLKNLN